MKNLEDITTEEKVRIFDQLYEQCLEIYNMRHDGEDHSDDFDSTYFEEGVVADVLFLKG